jgi:hypothetical protein
MNKRINRILEIVWLVLALLGLGAAIHKSVTMGVRESSLFFLITLVAAAMYMMRRNLRLRNPSEGKNE